MVLLFYLLGSFGTYVCFFGKVAENVWNEKLRTISTKWQGQVTAQLNYSLISHLDFKQHWRRNNQEPKMYLLFLRRGRRKTLQQPIHWIEFVENWPTRLLLWTTTRLKAVLVYGVCLQWNFMCTDIFEINKIHISKYTLVTLKHCLW